MSLEAVLQASRAAAETLMCDTCLVTRGATPVFNETSGQYDAPAATIIYSGKCKLQTTNVIVQEADAGDTEVAVTRSSVHFPVEGSETIQRGDAVTMTAALYDDAVIGLVFTVTGEHMGTAKSARRLPVTRDG